MAKRIVTRAGDIFCVEIENEHKRYLQYVTRDLAQLNSCVIRVFKHHYPMDYVFNSDEVIDDEIDFYVHTEVLAGVHHNVWYKVGKNSKVGNYDDVVFVTCNDLEESKTEKSNNWYLWLIGYEPIFIGELTDYIRSKTYYGGVLPPSWIYERLKNGKWHFNIPR